MRHIMTTTLKIPDMINGLRSIMLSLISLYEHVGVLVYDTT